MNPSDDPLLGDYLVEWLQRRRAQLRPYTFARYRRTINHHLRPRLGSLRLSELDRREVERVYAELLDNGALAGGPLAPQTIQQFHAILRRALEDARLDGLLERNPLEHVSPPKRHAGAVELGDDHQVWTVAQAVRFLEAVGDHPLRTLWYLALCTGARRGELTGLLWRDSTNDAQPVNQGLSTACVTVGRSNSGSVSRVLISILMRSRP